MGSDALGRLAEILKADREAGLRPGHKEVHLARSPGRLDVMGGVTDYSGGTVCALPLDVEAAVGVQRRDDRVLSLTRFDETGKTESQELSLDDFYGSASLLPDKTLQELFKGRNWAAQVAGVFPALARHKKITRRTHGANIYCYSDVPVGGLGGSAAISTAALFALTAAYHLILEPLEIATLAERVGHQAAGACGGVMDSVVSVLGKKNELMVVRCQPHEVEGFVAVPRGILLAGIHCGVWHSDTAYRRARVSAFMAQTIISAFYLDVGIRKDPTGGYLTRVQPELFEKYFRAILPERITGKAYLERHGPTKDRSAAVEAGEEYAPRAAAEHQIAQQARVRQFVEAIREAGKESPARRGHLEQAGRLMEESHASAVNNLNLDSAETGLLVELVKRRSAAKGFYGARISGGGSGGAVAVLAEDTAETRRELEAIAGEYGKKTGLVARVITESSAGASESPLKTVNLKR